MWVCLSLSLSLSLSYITILLEAISFTSLWSGTFVEKQIINWKRIQEQDLLVIISRDHDSYSKYLMSADEAPTKGIWAPSQYPKRRLFVRSRKVWKPRDWYFKMSYRFEIWQAHRQHCCRSACQISERSDNSKYKSRSFETLRDLTERRLFGYWDGALVN